MAWLNGILPICPDERGVRPVRKAQFLLLPKDRASSPTNPRNYTNMPIPPSPGNRGTPPSCCYNACLPQWLLDRSVPEGSLPPGCECNVINKLQLISSAHCRVLCVGWGLPSSSPREEEEVIKTGWVRCQRLEMPL